MLIFNSVWNDVHEAAKTTATYIIYHLEQIRLAINLAIKSLLEEFIAWNEVPSLSLSPFVCVADSLSPATTGH